MGLFSNMKSEGLEESQDRLGGRTVLDTDAYTVTIKMAYAIKSNGGAQGVDLTVDANGTEYREQLWITNRNGENFFMTKGDNPKKVGLPGFVLIDEICMLTTDAPLSEQNTEEKMVKVYDYDQKKEVPKSVPVLVDLLGKNVGLLIQKNLEDKTKKEGDEYVPTGETQDTNNIEKAFHAEFKLTVPEARAGKSPEEAAFVDAWLEKNKGKQRDRTSKDAKGGAAGAPPTSNAAAGSGAPRKSLFGNK